MYSFFKYQDKVSKTLEVEGVDYEQHSLVFGVWELTEHTKKKSLKT
jgi:hypothetical protein